MVITATNAAGSAEQQAVSLVTPTDLAQRFETSKAEFEEAESKLKEAEAKLESGVADAYRAVEKECATTEAGKYTYEVQPEPLVGCA